MAKVTVDDFPPHKLKDAYDAGKAYRIDHYGAHGVAREQPKIGDDGLPIIDDKRGTPQMERKRRARGGYRMVTPAGVVVHSPMSAGSGRGVDADPARRAQVMARLHARGTIRYGTCPVRDDLSMRWLTAKQRSEWTPCKPGSYDEYHPCWHIEEIIKERRERHAKREALAAERYRTIGEKQLEQDRMANQNVERLIAEMAKRKTYGNED